MSMNIVILLTLLLIDTSVSFAPVVTPSTGTLHQQLHKQQKQPSVNNILSSVGTPLPSSLWGTTTHRRRCVELQLFRKLFRRGGGNDGDNKDKDNGTQKDETEELSKTATPPPPPPTTTTTTTEPITKPILKTMLTKITDKKQTKEEQMIQRAKDLKEQAKRYRLEAEKMDTVLAMQKIDKLEAKLKAATTTPDETKKKIRDTSVKLDEEQVENLKKEIQGLKRKLNGEEDENDQKTSSSSTVNKTTDAAAVTEEETTTQQQEEEEKQQPLIPVLTTEEIDQRVTAFQMAPKFMQKLVAESISPTAATKTNDAKAVYNATQIVVQLHQDEQLYLAANTNKTTNEQYDMSYRKFVKSKFSDEEINSYADLLKFVPGFVKNLLLEDYKNLKNETNETEKAIAIMYQTVKDDDWLGDSIRDLAKDEKVERLKESLAVTSNDDKDDVQQEDEDPYSLAFPLECQKEDNKPALSEVKIFIQDVLEKNKIFTVKGEPEQVLSGYIIRGTSEGSTNLMKAMELNMEKSRIRNRLSFFYVEDKPFDDDNEAEEDEDIFKNVFLPKINSNQDPEKIIFVTGPGIRAEEKPFSLALLSASGLLTLWFSSIYPFLQNEKFLKLFEEQVALADAAMPSNLAFVNEMALPLFLSYIGIQLTHEGAHGVMAEVYGMNTTLPALVPSFVSGITGTITSFTVPPKDRQALFDYAMAGPLVGMLVSICFLVYGSLLTGNMDAESFANLPALPIQVLRQSSLAGALINYILPGVLDVSNIAAVSTDAVTTTVPAAVDTGARLVPLHPFAIAGYFSLLINAVNLLPVGRTDGGRVGLALFGRWSQTFVSAVTTAALLIEGLFGSDLLLFFFTYVIFFQAQMEIPLKNETESLDFGRILLAAVVGSFVLLSLVPM